MSFRIIIVELLVLDTWVVARFVIMMIFGLF